MVQREKVILELEDRLSKETDNAKHSMDGLKTAVKAVATVAVAQQVGRFAADVTQLAIDADEAGAAFDTTFGPATVRMSDFVDDFANKAGLANFELEQMLAITGNVVQGIGATEQESAALSQAMAELAGDVASFTNASGGSEDVLLALQSAINGEREALKTYGLAISEAEVQERALLDTGKEAADELTRLEKAHATVAVATEKAGKAVGDLDRTQDSAANSMRKLSAEWTESKAAIGEGLIPVLEAAIPLMSTAAQTFGGLGHVISDGVNYITSSVFNLRSAFGDLPAEAGEAMAELRGINDKLREGVPLTEAVAEGFANVARDTDLTQLSMLMFRDELGLTNDEILEAVNLAIDQHASLGIAIDDYKELKSASELLTGQIRDQNLAGVDWDQIHSQIPSGLERWQIAQENLNAPLIRSRNRLHELEAAAMDAAIATDSLRNANKLLTDDLRAASDPVFDLIRDWENLQGALEDPEASLFDIAEANLEVQAAMDALSPGNLVEALDAIATATGTDREEIRLLLEQMGILDGLVVKPVIDLQVRGAQRIGLTGGEEVFNIGGHIALAGGGLIPGATGSSVPVTAHGQERILNAEQNRLFERLVGAMSALPQGGMSQIDNSRSTKVQQFNEGFLDVDVSAEESLASSEIAHLLEDFVGVSEVCS